MEYVLPSAVKSSFSIGNFRREAKRFLTTVIRQSLSFATLTVFCQPKMNFKSCVLFLILLLGVPCNFYTISWFILATPAVFPQLFSLVALQGSPLHTGFEGNFSANYDKNIYFVKSSKILI
jgi:hypothetical protein